MHNGVIARESGRSSNSRRFAFGHGMSSFDRAEVYWMPRFRGA